MKKEKLRSYTKKVLAAMAKEKGIAGWHAMRKDELVNALATARTRRRAKGQSKRKPSSNSRTATRRSTPGAGSSETLQARAQTRQDTAEKDLSLRVPKDLPNGFDKDRIVVMVRDPYWLHAYWEITSGSIRRAEAALGKDWHSAKPVLRLLDVSSDETTCSAEAHVRDVSIHGGVNNWYIDVADPPRSFRVDIGYLTARGRFYAVARSNVVSTPSAGVSDLVDENWADVAVQSDRIYAMSGGNDPATSSLELKKLFEERLRRPMGSPAVNSFGSGAMADAKNRGFWFQVNAELIVYGATEPDSYVTLQGEPISLRPDGTFTKRFSLPDSRQIIPAVAASSDGIEERTIVLAIERNTKEMEPMIHDGNE